MAAEAIKTPNLPVGHSFRVSSQYNHRGFLGTQSIAGSSWFSGCSLGVLVGCSGINYLDTFEEKAEFVAALYRELRGPGHTIYSISASQLSSPLHQVLLELGSKELVNYPNLYHHSATNYIFFVNIREAVGRYCDENGVPYKEPREYVAFDWKNWPNYTGRVENYKP